MTTESRFPIDVATFKASKILLVLSISYVSLAIAIPVIADLGLCNINSPMMTGYVCRFVPSSGLYEFDKWGSYLSGILVPLSIVWVISTFNNQQKQFIIQAEMTRAAIEAAKAQSDHSNRQANVSSQQLFAGIFNHYVNRIEREIFSFSDLLQDTAEKRIHFEYVSRVEMDKGDIASTEKVFLGWYSLCVRVTFPVMEEDDHDDIVDEVTRDEVRYLLSSEYVLDFYIDFFRTFNKFTEQCRNADLDVLVLDHLPKIAWALKILYLHSSHMWTVNTEKKNLIDELMKWTPAAITRFGNRKGRSFPRTFERDEFDEEQFKERQRQREYEDFDEGEPFHVNSY